MITVFSDTLEEYKKIYMNQKMFFCIFSIFLPLSSVWIILNSTRNPYLFKIGILVLVSALVISLFFIIDFFGSKILKINDLAVPTDFVETVTVEKIQCVAKWNHHKNKELMLLNLLTKYGIYHYFISYNQLKELNIKPQDQVILKGKSIPGYWFLEKGQVIYDCQIFSSEKSEH